MSYLDPQPHDSDDDFLHNVGLKIILTYQGVLEIRAKLYDTFVLIHSFNNSSAEDKNYLIKRLMRQPNLSKMSAFIEAQAKVWNKFD